jgi:hypothetical protein
VAKTVTTKSGRLLTPADIESLANAAESGFDLSTWRPRRAAGRPPLDAEDDDFPSPRIAVRVPRSLHRRVTLRAEKEHRTLSEVVRSLLESYDAEGHGSSRSQ